MKKEEWVDVPDTNGQYRISNFGRVYSLPRKRVRGGLLKCTPDSGGYPIVNIYYKEKRMPVRVHRLVAISFISNPDNLPQVNHKNGNRGDNRVENLEWITNAGNARHAFDTGLNRNFGENNYASKLTENDIRTIRKMGECGFVHQLIADNFKVDRKTISDILHGLTWKNVH